MDPRTMEEKQVSSVPMKPIQVWGCHCGRRTWLLQCGASCSSQRMLVHGTLLTLCLGFCAGTWGPIGVNKDAPPSGPWWEVKESEYLTQNLNSPHGLASACRQKERGSECDLYYFSWFVPNMQNLGCAEQMLCWWIKNWTVNYRC